MSKRGGGSDEPVDDELPDYWHKSSRRIVGFSGKSGPSGSSGKPGPSRAGGKSSSRKEPGSRGLNILCLDGGGIRGLSELVLLSEAMDRLGAKYGIPTPKPADFFDIIAGSGTGGVIACMLGRLKMPIDVAIHEYGKLVRKGFSGRRSAGSGGATYLGSYLQSALREMVEGATGNENETMCDKHEGKDECKTIIFAMSKYNMNSGIPVLLRSYPALANSGPDCTIWEALYATMAHPDLFDSIVIHGGSVRQSYIGGDIGNSNPIEHVLLEVRSLYLGRYVSCVLSVGAGHPGTIHIPDSQKFQLFRTKELAAMKHMATDSERVAEVMARRFEDVKGVYFRLSVDQGMQNVDSDDWDKLDVVAAHTGAYLRKSDVSRVMNLVVQAIKDRKTTVAVAWIDGRIPVLTEPPISLKRCPAPTSVFTGRDDEIEGAGLCMAGGVDERRVCVLYGLGGAGKSQLAFKVVEKNRDYWARILYINASSKDAIEDALRSLAIAKEIGHSHTAALDWLGCLRERWLLILDNVNHPSVSQCISEYFPHGNRGSILITTRLADLTLHARGPSSAIRVSSMAPEQALLLLSKMIGLRGRVLPKKDIITAMKLLEDFGHLALAIVHAGAYIGHHPHMTIRNYHGLFLKGRQRMLELYSKLPVKIDDYDKTVYTTWVLCYVLLGRRAQQLLWLIAFLHPRGITTEIFRRASSNIQSYHPIIPLSDIERISDNYLKEYLGNFQDFEGDWDTVTFSDIISELASYSLIESDRINLSYNVHVLVQDWVRSLVLEEGGSLSQWLEHATTLLSRSIGREEILGVESINFKRALGPHISTVLAEHNEPIGANHATFFADVFKAREEWDKEERLRIQVKDELERRLDPEHQDVLKNADDLVAVYQNQGKWTEAQSLCSYVWEMRKSALNDIHIETITSAISLIEILQKQGRLDEARKLHKEVEKGFSEWFIRPCISALSNRSPNPGLELNRRGSLAIRLLRAAQCLGHSRGALIETMFIYDSMVGELGQADKHGQGQAQIAMELIRGVASLGILTEKFEVAMSQYEKLLHAQELAFGSGHRATQQTMQTLAATYLMLSKWQQANEIQRRVFDAYTHTFEESDQNTIFMKIAPCVTFTHIILNEWRQAFLFIQAIRAIGTQDKDGAGSVLKLELKSMTFLVMGTFELTCNLVRLYSRNNWETRLLSQPSVPCCFYYLNSGFG
ncbi:unnamed protein product [Rhizoctonia solani]|uniref:PNPLA domain-containing protein n=1 Tax=Rhizoctonia solani TaxID=456999 RepID=A0A8H3HJH3_9AGAM|nr:unnamed protein product [Rhizoctonia solani]